MAKRRRHVSLRASALATNSSKGIGRLRVHNPPGERKSGMPHSVEMPAPVKGTIVEAAAIMSPSCSTPLRRSGAITDDDPNVWGALMIAWPVGGCRRQPAPLSRRFGGRFLRLVDLVFRLVFLALPGLHD